MSDAKITKQEMHRFSRVIVMLFNRATMYQSNHPYVQQTIDEFFQVLGQLIDKVSPIVFILNREQLFIDEEPLDPRIIVTKIINHFSKTGIQSISFEKGLKKNDIRLFLDIFTSLDKYADADAMKKALSTKGIRHIKINHVVYIKATEDDELVSREALKEMTIELSEDEQQKARKQFMDMILESVLAEEFEKTLTIDNLLKNPQQLSQKMIEADRKGFLESDAEGRQPGPVLMHQLEMINQEIMESPDQFDTGMATDLVTAVFDMKNELLDGMEAQKADNFNYTEEDQIIGKINEVTDNVLLQLVKKETDPAGMSTTELGKIVGKWVPENELEGVLDRIKVDLAARPVAFDQILDNPAEVSKQMVEADVSSAEGTGGDQRNPGSVLMRQLDLVKQELVDKAFQSGGTSLSDVAAAVIELKEQLLSGMAVQKSLGTQYANEEKIVDKVTDITDKVILKLIAEEYQADQLTPQRLAQILRRLIPDTGELKRLLPKIKTILLEAGMPVKDYLELVKALGKELQSDELARVFSESAEEIGIDGDSLVEEIKKNPGQAAELIFLAAEIRKGTGDEKVMTDLLVDYIERLGGSLDIGEDKEDEVKGRHHLRRIIGDIESGIVGQLKNMNVKDDLIGRLEERLESRIDDILEKAKSEFIRSKSTQAEPGGSSELNVLQIIEQHAGTDEELSEIIEKMHDTFESENLDPDDFGQIYRKIREEEELRRLKESQRKLPADVLKGEMLSLLIKKEVSQAMRYGTPFAALGFSLIKATPVEKDCPDELTRENVMNTILKKMAKIVRVSDLIGEYGKNEIIVLLPFTPPGGARRALRRCLELLYMEPLEGDGISFTIKMAGVAVIYNSTQMPDAEMFTKELLNELMQMEIRIRNIQNLIV